MRFILASSSPRRRELLASIGVTFDIIKPDIDETQQLGEAPYDYVQRLSREKAQTVAQHIHTDTTILAADTIVLAADTVGVDETGDILGKPADADEARTMLRLLRDKPHIVCTAFTLLRIRPASAPITITEAVRTVVHMRNYTDEEIDAYIATGDPFDKAGSYAIQHEGFAPVAKIEGDYNNVVGLPIDAVQAALKRLSGDEIEQQKRYGDRYDYNFVYPENQAFVDGELRYPVNADEIKASIRRVLEHKHDMSVFSIVVGIVMVLSAPFLVFIAVIFIAYLFSSDPESTRWYNFDGCMFIVFLPLATVYMVYFSVIALFSMIRSAIYWSHPEKAIDKVFEQMINKKDIRMGKVNHKYLAIDGETKTINFNYLAPSQPKNKQTTTDAQGRSNTTSQADLRADDEVVFLHLDEDINGIL